MLIMDQTPFTRGAYGKIHRGRLDDRPVIAKVARREMYANELNVLKKLLTMDHPNIVSCISLSVPILIMEEMHEDLHAMLEALAKMDVRVDAETIKSVIGQLLSGLTFLHKNQIIHADVKPSNILLRSGRVALADFSLSMDMETNPYKDTGVVSANYRAPELWMKDGGFSYGIDVWAAGVVLFEMAWGQHIVETDKASGALTQILKVVGTPNRIPNWPWPDKPAKTYARQTPFLTPELYDGSAVARRLLAFNMNERISARDARLDPFFKI